MPSFSRVALALVLFAIALFCGFGYLATFEPLGFVLLRYVYAVSGGLCLAAAGLMLFRPRHDG
ncbi:hypothetical protein GC170_19110 [bacterium]|nr:hypothetical protein [bacterium]